MTQLNQLRLIIREIPRHLLNRKSWLFLAKEPLQCVRYVVAPVLFAFSQRNKRSKEALHETALNHLVNFINPTQVAVPIETWPAEPDLFALRNRSQLKQLIDQLAINKSDKHLLGYASIYQIIVAQIRDRAHGGKTKIVEIGIGSNNPRVASNMGVFGTPGASLRAFRDFLPGAQLVGGDIDRTILFEEPGITTHFVDQLDTNSLRHFFSEAGLFDLFIEDGLHELDANLNTLCTALEFVKEGAWIVIEDISLGLEPVWLAVAELLGRNHRCWVIRANVSLVFVAQRRYGSASELSAQTHTTKI